MASDPNVQVAIISVVSTLVTTSGVILVAIISKPPKGKRALTSHEPCVDCKVQIAELKKANDKLQVLNEHLEDELYRKKKNK